MKRATTKETRLTKNKAQDTALFIFANPNPILQFTKKGVLHSSNQAGQDFLKLCGTKTVNALVQDVIKIGKPTAKEGSNVIERECGQTIYSFTVVSAPETPYINLYGKEITEQRKAERALVEQENTHKNDQARLHRNEEYRRSLFNHMAEGFALYEMIEGKDGTPIDYRFLEVNNAYEKLTGLRRDDILHKLRSSIAGGLDPEFIKIYGEVAQSGKPAHFVDYSKTLEKYFDILAFRLDTRRVAILFSDITAQKQEDAAKNNFIAIMAHELRNPLMPIFTNTEILGTYLSGRRHDTDIKVKEAVRAISRQANTMGKLLDDLLDISRIIRGKITLNKKPISLCQSIQNAIETTRPLMESQKHTFSSSFPPSPVYIDADPIRIEQIITNLLNNATKYTKPGGHISLEVEQKADATVLIKVRDTGIGIKPKDVKNMFKLFAQFSKPFVETHGDFGIGLKIIKDIVTMHGGTVSVKSDGINQGSEFSVCLPTIPATTETKPESSKKQTDAIAKRKILIVDDNKDISDSLKRLLTHLGNEIEVANDGKGALSAAETFKPEMILLDIGLPDMTGYEVAHDLRAKHGKDMKIVALTGYGQEKDKLLSKEAGFDYHMTKPVSINDINQTIKNAFMST